MVVDTMECMESFTAEARFIDVMTAAMKLVIHVAMRRLTAGKGNIPKDKFSKSSANSHRIRFFPFLRMNFL